jgi:hypothetical protein
MYDEPRAVDGTVTLAVTRLLAALDTLSTAIAGFALLAGARAFTFTALLAWREPVLGGAGLVLLGLVGWLRWCWRSRSYSRHCGISGPTAGWSNGRCAVDNTPLPRASQPAIFDGLLNGCSGRAPVPASNPLTCESTQRRNCTSAGRSSSRSGQ